MMPESRRRCCLLLMVVILAEVSLGSSVTTGTEYITKSGCRGDAIELFQSIPVKSDDTVASLYKTEDKDDLLAMWIMRNSVLNVTLVNGYKDKFFMDSYGNIWIRKLHIADEAKYTIIHEKGSKVTKFKVQLLVLVAPTTRCKPKIVRVDNILTAYLEGDDCGRPAPSVYWMEHPSVSSDSKAVRIQPENGACTYYACIDSDALRCAESLKLTDYCASYMEDESVIQTTLSGVSHMITGSVPIGIFIVLLLLGNFIMNIIELRRMNDMRKRKVESRPGVESRSLLKNAEDSIQSALSGAALKRD